MAQYTILPGDTINSIAKRAGLTREEFLRLNPNITSRADIEAMVGQNVRLGAGNEITKITFSDVARSLGMSREELLELNPQISEDIIGSGVDVTGWEIWTPNNDTFFTDNNRVSEDYRFWDAENQQFTDRPAGDNPDAPPSFAPTDLRGNTLEQAQNDPNSPLYQDPTMQDPGDLDPEDLGIDVEALLNADPEYLAMLREFDFELAMIESARVADNERLQNQFDAMIPQWERDLLEGRRNIEHDFAGRGMYFSSGRGYEHMQHEADISTDREQARNQMEIGQNQIDAEAAEAAARIENAEAEGTLAATERVTEAAMEDMYPELF
jgi:predicted metal-binding transcription factor (methanogenesis marker protein 9)